MSLLLCHIPEITLESCISIQGWDESRENVKREKKEMKVIKYYFISLHPSAYSLPHSLPYPSLILHPILQSILHPILHSIFHPILRPIFHPSFTLSFTSSFTSSYTHPLPHPTPILHSHPTLSFSPAIERRIPLCLHVSCLTQIYSRHAPLAL